MAIIDITKTQIYVVSGAISTVAQSLRVKDRVFFCGADKKLYRYTGTTFEILPVSDIKYGATLEDLPTSATNGCIGIVANGGKPIIYVWIDSSWVVGGGAGGTVSLAEAKVNLPADADAGDIAVVKAENALYYYDGANWVSTEPKVNIDEVYVAAGNIAVGSKLENLTLQEFAERLLTKEINPVITQPSASIAISGLAAGLQEIGTTTDITFTSTFNRGKVAKGWGDKATMNAYYSGLPTSYTYDGFDLSTDAKASTALTDTATASGYEVKAGAQTCKVTVAFSAGDYQPVTNYGNNYSTKCAAGSKVSNTITITGVYPVFATTTNITTATKQALVNEPANASSYVTINMVAEEGGKQFFELPGTWADLTGVADSGGTFLNGNKANSILQWTKTEVEETVQGKTVAYKRYTHNAANAGKRTLRIYTK